MKGLRWLVQSPNARRVLLAALVAAVVVFFGGLYTAGELEKNNDFCGSCHTEPESQYLTRFMSALSTNKANDLAAYHHRQLYPRQAPNADNIRCIDCHVGEGIVGRGIVLSLAALDALKYFTRTATQPAKVVFTIQNEACLKCHNDQVRIKDFEKHFHYKLFEVGAPFEQCVACHISHEEGVEQNGFIFRKAVIPVCEDCHKQEGKGPIKMQ